MEIKELTTKSEIEESFPLIHLIREKVSKEQFLKYLDEMISNGYRVFVLKENDKIISIATLGILRNYYFEKHVWVYELVTLPEFRSKGYGEKLMKYIEKFAKDNGCSLVALSSGIQREDAHRFYEKRLDYDKVSSIFTKKIN